MPVLESAMSYDTMKKRLTGYQCGECGSGLTLCWGGAYGYNQHILRCAKDINHSTINDHKEKTEQQIEGENTFRRLQGMDSKSLMAMDKNTMLARVGQAKFPKDLTPIEKQLMAEVAISYGFDPLMQELMIYQGNPYVTSNGRFRKAQETNKLDGIDGRPATKQEREDRHAKLGDLLYMAEVWVKGASHSFKGWGRVLAKETHGSEHLPIVKDPDRMAEKRAESQALRKAFSLPLPSWEEAEQHLAEMSNGRQVHKGTGEIIEGKIIDSEHEAEEQSDTEIHLCKEHGVPYDLKRGKFGSFYAHKVEGGWCNEKKKKASKAEPALEPDPGLIGRQLAEESGLSAPPPEPLPEEPEPEPGLFELTEEVPTAEAPADRTVNKQELSDLTALMQEKNLSYAGVAGYFNGKLGWGLQKTADMTLSQFNELVKAIEDGKIT